MSNFFCFFFFLFDRTVSGVRCAFSIGNREMFCICSSDFHHMATLIHAWFVSPCSVLYEHWAWTWKRANKPKCVVTTSIGLNGIYMSNLLTINNSNISQANNKPWLFLSLFRFSLFSFISIIIIIFLFLGPWVLILLSVIGHRLWLLLL